MKAEHDLLERVIGELDRRRGDLRDVAKEAGLSYDTVLRIKNRENDPGYSKVKALAEVLFADERAASDPVEAKAA
ncbi:MAG: helix-turn-helix transcriptional regulator [Rubrivivax sp.]|nr:helix-turn-helix transcriptional regulator [Rubrivivax sp.]